MMDTHEVRAHRRLWIAIACAAVEDAARDICRKKSPEDRQAAVRRHAGYFRGRWFAEICDLAGLGDPPVGLILDFLGSDKVRSNRIGMSRALGLTASHAAE